MERKDQRDPYSEQRAESWRRTEAQIRDEQIRPERQQFAEMDRSGGRQYEGEQYPESGRQYGPSAGYGSERQGHTAAGQPGKGYYGGRPMRESAGADYGGGQYARGGGDDGYGRQGG